MNRSEWNETLQNKAYQARRFIYFVIKHFLDDDCTYRASALAFTTLLTIVPLMTVGFAIFSSFPVFQGLSDPMQDFIFDNFVPATGKVIQNYLHQFAAQVSRLSVWGVAFLFGTALLLMVTIERAMNKIWRVNSSRQGVAAFLLYWAILSLSPILVGLSLAASSYLFSIPLFQYPEAPSLLLSSIPLILSLTGFTFLYVVVPNCPIKFRHGLIGGLFATFLFECARQSFAFYLSRYNNYELLYGAFATVPIFFVWVYWVWLITLLGAEVSYALSVHHQRRVGEPLDGFSHALLWLRHLWLKQKEGKGMMLIELIESTNQPFTVDSSYMINSLKRLKLIDNTDDGHFILSRDLNDVTLYWLTQQLPYSLPTQIKLNEEDASQSFEWHEVFEENDKLLQKSLSIKLADLFSDKPRNVIQDDVF